MMCEITWIDLVNIVSFYWDNLSSVQIRMEFWAAIVSKLFSYSVGIGAILMLVYVLFRYWNKMKIWQRIYFIFGALFFGAIAILAYPESKESFYYYACKRKSFVGNNMEIDTVLGYVYKYEYECYKGRRSFYRGGGYVKYVYRVLGVDSVLEGEYKFDGSFLCDIDTGFYYVIVPRGKWDNSIILLEEKIPWDTVKVWLERMNQGRYEEVKSGEQVLR